MRRKPPARRSLRLGLLLRRRPRLRHGAGRAAGGRRCGLAVAGRTCDGRSDADAAWGTPRARRARRHAATSAPGDRARRLQHHARSIARRAVVPAARSPSCPPARARRRRGARRRGAARARAWRRSAPASSPPASRRARGPWPSPSSPAPRPPLTVGDQVDVLVALAPEAAGDGPPGFALGRRGVAGGRRHRRRAVTVAVPADDAPRLAVALGQGAVTLAAWPIAAA